MECDVYTKKVFKKFNTTDGIVNPGKWISKEWLVEYNEFTKDKNYYVKILELEENEDHFLITMEKLDIICPSGNLFHTNTDYDVNVKDLENLYRTILNILLDTINYKKPDYMFFPLYWIHDDFHLNNIVFLKDRTFKLIDPNAFQWKRGSPCTPTSLAALNNCLYMSMDYYYRLKHNELRDLFKNVDHFDLLADKLEVENLSVDTMKKYSDEILAENKFSDLYMGMKK